MASIFQKSFSSGEIAPPCYARCDLLKYATGARTVRNMFVARHGGAYNRPGSIYKSTASDSAHRIRLFPFSLPNGTKFQLEFGHLYVRVLRDGVPIQTSVKTLSTVTKAVNASVTFKEYHSMQVGDQITFASVGGMTQLNGLTGTIVTVPSSSQVTVNIDSTGFSNFTTGGTATPVSPRDIKYTTVYTESVLRELTFAQENNTLIIAHQSGFPMQFTYSAPESWAIVQDSTLVKPVIGATTVNSGPITTWLFFCSSASANSGATYTNNGVTFTVVTTIAAQTLLTCTAISIPTSSGVLTKASGTGDATITFSSVQLSGSLATYWGITAIAQDTYEESLIALWGTSLTTGSLLLGWNAVSGAIQYNVYRGSYYNTLGFLAVSNNNFYQDDFSLKPDFTAPPPIERTIFTNIGGGAQGSMLPAAVGYFQQRRYWGNMGPAITALGIPPVLPIYPNYADRVFGSRIGSPTYFNEQRPTPDDGQLSFRMLNKVPQEIRHFLDLGKLCIFTAQGEWILGGDPSSGGITPSTVNPTNVSQNGSGFTAPLAIGNTALYVQYNSTLNTSIIRTFGFEFQIDGYRGDDVTIYSSHLVDNHQIYAMAHQKLPHPIVWMVRDDGTLLGLTFLPEQNVLAWHRHDFTNGLVEDVISSGGEIFVVVLRTINGSSVRYIEKLASRSYTQISDAIFVDACKTFDGRNTDTTKTMTISGGSTWAYDETLTLTCSTAFFSGSSVGRFVHIRGPNNELIRFKINAQSSTTVVSGTPDKTVPATMRSVALSSWSDARTTITGLSHLEGQKVSVLGDGFVVANPNNSNYQTLTVSGGSIALSTGDIGYGVVQVGLPITSELETLDIDNPQGPTMLSQKKNITKVLAWVDSSRAILAGPARADRSNDPTDLSYLLDPQFDELKYRYKEGYDDPCNMITAPIEINIEGHWNSNGRILLRQIDPLPIGILAVAPDGYIPIGAP